MPRPVLDIERRIIHGHERIARVAEDRFEEIQVADERSGAKTRTSMVFSEQYPGTSGQTTGRSMTLIQ